jgi:preprotein translocase subunit SecE
MQLASELKDYLRGSYSELKKVVWPTKEQTTNYTIIVIAMSIGLAAFFAILDKFFNYLIGFVL